MKNPSKKSLQQKLQDKEYFLKEITAKSTLGSCDSNFKKTSFLKGEIGRRLLYLIDCFQSCFELGFTFFMIQNQKEFLDHDLLVNSILELESSFTVKF